MKSLPARPAHTRQEAAERDALGAGPPRGDELVILHDKLNDKAWVRPTFKSALLFSLSIPLALVLPAGWSAFWPLTLYAPLCLMLCLVLDLGLALPLRCPQTKLYAPARLSLGSRGEAVLLLTANGQRRAARVEALLEQSGGTAESPTVSGLLRPGETLRLALPILPLRRGQTRLEALWLRRRGPLGLLEFRRRIVLAASVAILPELRGLHEEALRFYLQDQAFGLKSLRLRGEGAEFESLRDFAPGMDSRFIDWKSSARHRKTLCKEFCLERNHQLVLAFDTGRLMLEENDGLSRLDRAIRAGLLLGRASLQSGDFLGGCAFAARPGAFLKPGRGLHYFARFRQFAAALDYNAEETNFSLGLAELNSRLQRRALIVLFTEFTDSINAELLLESLRILLRRHLVIFALMRSALTPRLVNAPPDNFYAAARAVLAADLLRERAVALEKAARLGAQVLDAPGGELSAALLNRYLLIRHRGML